MLSHGDYAHVGALPLISKRLNRPLNIVCTKPVLDMAKMVLYDACIYLDRLETVEKRHDERGDEICTNIFSFTLDDIDHCFERVSLVKYSEEKIIRREVKNLPKVSRMNSADLRLSALPSGRTVGGSSWLVSYGAATVIYAVGINTKKESVLDGLNLELFPRSPSLLIVDGDCSTTKSSGTVHRVSRGKGRKESSAQNPLVTTVMESIRKGLKNILIPCESGGRALELMQLLTKNVMNDKSRLEVDRLIYLTPMASNVVDFAKAQLEWMSDSLCDAFYKGGTNPFEFNAITHQYHGKKQMELLKCVTSLEELDQIGNAGVKIVLTTDSSLSAGFSKELLLRWGGNPSSMVIFTSEPEIDSLGADVLRQIKTPPVLATIVRREKVLLQGEELHAYLKAEEEKKRVNAEAELQNKREAELNAFIKDVKDVPEDSEDEISDAEVDENSEVAKLRKPKKHAVMLGGLGKYAKPRYAQFENFEIDVGKAPFDMEIAEYGKPITDLNLPKTIKPAMKRSYDFASVNSVSSNVESGNKDLESQGNDVNISEEVKSPPSKLMKVTDKVQLTCEFSHIPLDGRADLKTMRTIISEINPQHVVVLKGKSSGDHMNVVMSYIKDGGYDACSPADYEGSNFEASGGVRKISLPGTTRNDTMKRVRGSGCILKSITAEIKNTVFSNEGEDISNLSLLEVQRSIDADDDFENTSFWKKDDNTGQIINEFPLCLSSLSGEIGELNTLGRLSVGEVSLKSLKSTLTSDQKGMQVEYKLRVGSATLLCNQQSTIRKINKNDLVIEGPPGMVFNDAKLGVYSNFSYL